MSDMPWVRFFPSDWLGGTRGMSAAETGVYITLIATMYERGEPVPEDHPRLARLCGASNSTFKTALESLVSEGKIVRSETGLWNDRVAKEQSYRSEKSEVGKQAAIARWGQKDNKNNVHGDANALPTQCQGNANQKPEPDKSAIANAIASPEPDKSAPAERPAIVAELPTVSGEMVPIHQPEVEEWQAAFPAVDVRQQLAAMRAWLTANPTRRKTKRGMRRFVVAWLDREQNRGGRPSLPLANGHGPPTHAEKVNEALDRIINGKPTHEHPDFDTGFERRDGRGAEIPLRLVAFTPRH